MKKIILLVIMLCALLMARAQSWTMQNVGFHMSGSNPFQISIVNSNVVWVSGAMGVVNSFDNEFSRTTDGGLHWQRGTIPMDSSYGILSIEGLDENTAYAITGSIPSYGSLIMKTVDGGANWNAVDSGLIYAASTSFAVQIHFFDPANGLIVGDPVANRFEIFTTADSGNTWSLVTMANSPVALSGEFTVPKSFEFRGSTCWFGTSAGRIFKSTDYGLHWTVSSTGVSGLPVLCFTDDAQTGYACVYNGNFYYKKTTDGGSTWTSFNPAGPVYFLLRSIPGTNILISFNGQPVNGSSMGSSYSTDGGNNWIAIDSATSGSPTGYGWMQFKDINTGWAGGIAQDSLTGGIYKWSPGILQIKDEHAFTSALNVFPNPSSGLVYFKAPESNFTLRVSNESGAIIQEVHYQNKSIGELIEVDINKHASGLYVVDVIGEKHSSSRILIR